MPTTVQLEHSREAYRFRVASPNSSKISEKPSKRQAVQIWQMREMQSSLFRGIFAGDEEPSTVGIPKHSRSTGRCRAAQIMMQFPDDETSHLFVTRECVDCAAPN